MSNTLHTLQMTNASDQGQKTTSLLLLMYLWKSTHSASSSVFQLFPQASISINFHLTQQFSARNRSVAMEDPPLGSLHRTLITPDAQLNSQAQHAQATASNLTQPTIPNKLQYTEFQQKKKKNQAKIPYLYNTIASNSIQFNPIQTQVHAQTQTKL